MLNIPLIANFIYFYEIPFYNTCLIDNRIKILVTQNLKRNLKYIYIFNIVFFSSYNKYFKHWELWSRIMTRNKF